jgi:hypothetical protein
MSDEEKAIQIGNAVMAYQASKVALAHVEEKIKRVQDAYKQAAESGTGKYPALRVVDGKLAGYSGPEAWMRNLINEADFAILLSERDECMAEARANRLRMDSLGLGSL